MTVRDNVFTKMILTLYEKVLIKTEIDIHFKEI